jgi:outer membrane receptor protein involved in Fe transport
VGPDRLRLTLTGVYTGRTPLQRTGTEVLHRDPFVRFDARLARTVYRGLDLSLGVDNAFDAVPEDWPGFTGRRVYVGLTWGVAGR